METEPPAEEPVSRNYREESEQKLLQGAEIHVHHRMRDFGGQLWLFFGTEFPFLSLSVFGKSNVPPL